MNGMLLLAKIPTARPDDIDGFDIVTLAATACAYLCVANDGTFRNVGVIDTCAPIHCYNSSLDD